MLMKTPKIAVSPVCTVQVNTSIWSAKNCGKPTYVIMHGVGAAMCIDCYKRLRKQISPKPVLFELKNGRN